MIHKQFRNDGTPDLNRWVFECDTCWQTAGIYAICPDCGLWHLNKDLARWLVPGRSGMQVYCPGCFYNHAEFTINNATACPVCGANNFRLWHDDLDDTLSAECQTCGTYTFGTDFPGSQDGWFTP